MGIYVNTNVTALRGQNYLQNINTSLNTTYQRLSSGLRINSAKDDAAGLQIANRLTTQVNGLNQGNRNANDSIALAQTIEGGLDEITNILQRIRTLAVQSANGTLTNDDRNSISQEAAALTDEINRIAEQTTYGGKRVLFGADADTAGKKTIYNNSGLLTVAGVALGSDNTGMLTGQIKFQVGANSGDAITLNVESFTMSAVFANATITGGAGPANISEAGMASDKSYGGTTNRYRFVLSTAEYASLAINSIDKYIARVDTQRSSLGSIQNRLESTIKVQSNTSVNTADARARIRDTDFAEESANLSQQSIIQQAATSMLLQSNMRPQLALTLLG